MTKGKQPTRMTNRVTHTSDPVATAIRTRGVVLILSAVALLLSCDPSTDRPPFGPFDAAVRDTVTSDPAAAIAAIAAEITSVGLRVRAESRRDGFLETGGFDVTRNTSSDGSIYHPDRVVTFRFWADSIPGDRTRITGEATVRVTSDPSLDRRMTERMVQPDHAGYELLQRIISGSKSRIGG